MMKLIVWLDSEILSVLPAVSIAPHVNSTITTKDGNFSISEVGFDYVKNEINCYTDEGQYNVFNDASTYDRFGNAR